MDPKEMLSAAAEALGLEAGASAEQVAEAAKAAAMLAEAAEGAPAEEPETEAAKGGDDEVKASTVEAMDMPPEGGEEPSADAVAGDAGAVVEMLAELTGMEAAAVLGALREYADDIAAMIQGAPPAEADMAAASARVAAMSARVTAEKKRADALTARVAELEAAEDARLIEDAIGDGRILEEHRQLFVELSRSNREAFVRHLADAKSPAPQGRVYASQRAARQVSVDDEQVAALRKKLTAAGISAARIDTEIERIMSEG